MNKLVTLLVLVASGYVYALPQSQQIVNVESGAAAPNQVQSRQLFLNPQQDLIENLPSLIYSHQQPPTYNLPPIQYPQYQLPLLDTPLQYPTINYAGNKPQIVSSRRTPPQILFYSAPTTGQQFLVPTVSPQGNILLSPGIPSPETNFILKDILPGGRPLFTHQVIPPQLEKDAEEIPNDAKSAVRLNHGAKPEKLETLDKSSEKADGVQVVASSSADGIPATRTSGGTAVKSPKPTIVGALRPGQRFFVLNGQTLIPAYPAYQSVAAPPFNDVRLKYVTGGDSSFNQPQPQFTYGLHNDGQQLLRKAQNPAFFGNLNPQDYPQDAKPNEGAPTVPLLLFQQPFPTTLAHQQRGIIPTGDPNFLIHEADQSASDDSDVVVIDAKLQDDTTSGQLNQQQSTAGNGESTVSQAQPAAIALAGAGGVAAASPRGTAFVGKGGLAVSSPQATAVAGPKDEAPTETNTSEQTNNNKSNSKAQ